MISGVRANNRIENSHQAARRRERKMRRISLVGATLPQCPCGRLRHLQPLTPGHKVPKLKIRKKSHWFLPIGVVAARAGVGLLTARWRHVLRLV
jgi:hypothetical protein